MVATTTNTVNDLVRQGRATPRQGAVLLELRDDLAERRERTQFRRSPLARIGFALVVFVLALLGVRREG